MVASLAFSILCPVAQKCSTAFETLSSRRLRDLDSTALHYHHTFSCEQCPLPPNPAYVAAQWGLQLNHQATFLIAVLILLLGGCRRYDDLELYITWTCPTCLARPVTQQSTQLYLRQGYQADLPFGMILSSITSSLLRSSLRRPSTG
jgi:hypothetical protein